MALQTQAEQRHVRARTHVLSLRLEAEPAVGDAGLPLLADTAQHLALVAPGPGVLQVSHLPLRITGFR